MGTRSHASLVIADWMGDVQSNLGWSLTPGGEIYVGKWAAGERNGCGLLVGSDGDVYYGQFRQDACSGWGVQQTVDWDETGETIKKGRWELGKHTLKRFRGGVAYYVEADKELPQKEEEQVQGLAYCSRVCRFRRTLLW